jgi:methylated-DNA-[protein]-cysteine S-methyltransferase
MPHASLNNSFGVLTVFEEAGALAALEWGRAPEGAMTALLAEAIAQLEAYFDGRLRAFSLPLHDSGSTFQRRVWSRLREIRYGEVATYGSLAVALGTSPRALAQACAVNPLPILVPCHRVVAARGCLGGYSGGDGPDTKQALLRLEGVSLTVGARRRSSRAVDISTQTGDLL